ncbi:MAG: orotidine-5'-phosphate decarboxylase [Candidatus Argoarchaeum ethanivorans]|uniref:Orotidine 5'-phosphate decarboxylase n=1 Tax=Candidatus Argoarchaeum ethanivorans TaxID=2608793 RepID=A0A8B3S3Y8_9EURY|nr:MAG: orotidine-5'-phosphate decarboxylase [Candidatus Argoarchaeum ethanivorans]
MRELNEKEEAARKMICLPLDGLKSMDEIKSRVEELNPVVGLFKIGKETFTRFGPAAVNLVQSYGSEVFLDLKYHDIPNTVRGAAVAASELGVEIFDVHASGGLEMMKAAVTGVLEADVKKKPKVIGVTILTSIDKDVMNNQLNIPGAVDEQVLCLAKLAEEAGLSGIVCSGADLLHIRSELSADFMFVTPGIKRQGTEAGADQRRVTTPLNAVKDGSSILVIGRAITGAPDRIQACLNVIEDIARVL